MLAETMRLVVERVTGNKLKAEDALNERAELSQHQCYKAALNHYKNNCFNWHRAEVEAAPEGAFHTARKTIQDILVTSFSLSPAVGTFL